MTDPASIPERVRNAAIGAHYVGTRVSTDERMARAIAAALDALMDDEQVRVPTYYKRTTQPSGHRYTTGRDVLAAVLARGSTVE